MRDFKLKLAQSTVVGRLYLDAPQPKQRGPENRSPLWREVFAEARAALATVENTLAVPDILKAAELIAKARQVMTFGFGG